MAGEVIGVNSALVSPTGSSVGIGFAIPSEIAMQVVDELIAHGRMDRGWLGVVVDVAPKHRPGALITTVDANGPGADNGLRPGDVVTLFNGEKVATPSQLIRDVSAVNPGGTAHLRIKRRAQIIDVTVTVARRPPEPAAVDPQP
jgi:serine protease Do